MQTLTTTDLQRGTAKAVATVLSGEPLAITRNGQTVGYLVPPGAYQAIDLLSVGTIADATGVPWQEISRRVTELISDAAWGRDAVILSASPDNRRVVLSPTAAWHILTQLNAQGGKK